MALLRNDQLKPIWSPTPYPPELGNHCSVTAKIKITMRANQKYGSDDRNVVIGTSASRQFPRRQPTIIPSTVPSTNPMTVQNPISTSVQKMLCRITWITAVG